MKKSLLAVAVLLSSVSTVAHSSILLVTKSDFLADKSRQDKAIQNNAAAIEAERDRAWKEEQKQWNEIQTKYTEAAGKALEGQVKANADRITSNTKAQAERDAGQDEHINAVQGAAQTANDRATALEGRADVAEGAIRETNAQVEVTDKRSRDNAVRLDGVEQVNGAQNDWIGNVETTSNAAWDRATTNSSAISRESDARAAGDAQTLRSANAYTDSRVSGLSRDVERNRRDIEENRKEARAGIAGAMAMSQIPQVGNYGRFSFAAGIGQYVNQQALAVGFSSRIGDRVITKGAVSADSSSNFGAGLGIGFEW